MRVLSLFDGISCGRLALNRAGIEPSLYLASEINMSCVRVTQSHFPDTIQLGDVTEVRKMIEIGALTPGQIDLLIGGPPCQGLSSAGKRLNFFDERSFLFFEFLAIKNALKPRFFLMENVIMKKDCERQISELLGVEPVAIDSADFCAQNRKRLYWTNIPSTPRPSPSLADEFWAIREWGESDRLDTYRVPRTPWREKMWHQKCKNVSYALKTPCLTTKQDGFPNAGLIEYRDFCRFLTIEECEKLQTVPPGYCKGMTRSQAYHALGNGWTVDVIAYLFKGLVS